MLNNKKLKNNNIVIMNFTGVYENQEFYQELGAVWLELGDIQGTNCYCDDEAEAAIKERISLMEPSGIHFLDSGNYHYVSKIWLDKIEEEFELLVFDHHTDMQMPMFGNILSCGGWIQAALDTNTRLKRVYLAGPPSMEAEADRERVVGINEEELKTPGCISRHLKNSGLPLYISLDKDILTRSCAITNWDQGEAQLEDVLACIKEAASCCSIIGVDVCGENPDDQEQEGNRASQTNQSTNREIVCKLLEICDVLCP